MIRYYKEKSGDYLSWDGSSHYSQNGRMLEIRAAAIEGNSFSVCTTSMTVGYRKTCKRVKFEEMPENWKKALNSNLIKLQSI